MLNHFHVVKQTFAVPVMSESAPAASDPSGNAPLNISRSLQSTSEQLQELTRIVSSQAVSAVSAADLQNALVASTQALQQSTLQLAAQQTNLAESQATIATTVSDISTQLNTAVTKFAADNAAVLASLASLNASVAINVSHIDSLMDSTTSLVSLNVATLSKSVRLEKWDGSSRNRANWFSVSRSRFRQHNPRCEELVSDASLTFDCDAATKLPKLAGGKRTCVVTADDRALSALVYDAITSAVTDKARIVVQSAFEKYRDLDTGNGFVAWEALEKLGAEAAEANRAAFMNKRSVDGSDQREHITNMKQKRWDFLNSLADNERAAHTRALADGLLASLAPALRERVQSAIASVSERTYELVERTALQLIADDEQAASGNRRARAAGSAFFNEEGDDSADEQYDANWVKGARGRGGGRTSRGRSSGRGYDHSRQAPSVYPPASSGAPASSARRTDGCLMCGGDHMAWGCPNFACDQHPCSGRLPPGKHNRNCQRHADNRAARARAGRRAYSADVELAPAPDTYVDGDPDLPSVHDAHSAQARAVPVFPESDSGVSEWPVHAQVDYAAAAGSWSQQFDDQRTADYDATRGVSSEAYSDACAYAAWLPESDLSADDNDDFFHDARDAWCVSAKTQRRRDRRADAMLSAVLPKSGCAPPASSGAGVAASARAALSALRVPDAPWSFQARRVSAPLSQLDDAERYPSRAPRLHSPAWPTLLCYFMLALTAHARSTASPTSLSAPGLALSQYRANASDFLSRNRSVPVSVTRPGDWVRVPPPGWYWRTIAVDSGCNVHMVSDPAVFRSLRSSKARVRVADGRYTTLDHEGPVVLQTYNTNNQPVTLVLSRALHSTRVKSLLSVSELTKAGCDVVFSHTGKDYIVTPSGGTIRLRQSGGLSYLDYLVPRNPNVPSLRRLPPDALQASSAQHKPRYFVDICAGSCTSLVYHLRQDPHAHCMAIDILSEHRIRRMVPKPYRHRFTYVRMNVSALTPSLLHRLVSEQWGISPTEVDHYHYSPDCTTLSRATHGKDVHYHDGRPISPKARHDYASMVRVLSTLQAAGLDPSHTLVTVENPVGRFRTLPIVQTMSTKPDWHLFDRADHCSMADTADNPPVSQKPTSWLVFSANPPPVLPVCRSDCRFRVTPDSPFHSAVMCYRSDLQPGQRVMRDPIHRARIPLGAYAHFWKSHIGAASSLCACSACFLHASDPGAMTANVGTVAEHDKSPTIGSSKVHDVYADLADPAEQFLRMRNVPAPALWHRRFGHFTGASSTSTTYRGA
jgi:hypothetical protein